MNDEELKSFLDRSLTATIATANAAGTPHGIPVWYRYDGSLFTTWTDLSRKWVRNVVRRPEVGVVVAEHQPPFAAVVARGIAEVATDAAGTDDEIRLIASRYLPQAAVDDYIAQWANLRTIVRIKPRVLHSWGRGY